VQNSTSRATQRVAHYFVAQYQSGEASLQLDAPEISLQDSHNHYAPTWVRLEQVADLPLFPSIICQRLAMDLQASPNGVIRLVETD
jgi:cytochrome oxidase assembly protein ShyY1